MLGGAVLALVVCVMALAAARGMHEGFSFLLYAPTDHLNFDLRLHHEQARRFVGGEYLYGDPHGTYPPASYAMVWLLVGWIDLDAVRLVWAAFTALSLAWLSYLLVRGSGARGVLQTAFVALVPLCLYSTRSAVGNGQAIVPTLAAALVVVLAARERPLTWFRATLLAPLVVLALFKPHNTVPLLWLAVVAPSGWRAIVPSGAVYGALALVASWWQGIEPIALHLAWLRNTTGFASTVTGMGGANANNVHALLALIGLDRWMFVATAVLFVGYGVWSYAHRKADVWLLLGVGAVVARLWTYHRFYDDVLLAVPAVALFRVVKDGERGRAERVVAGALLAGVLFVGVNVYSVRFLQIYAIGWWVATAAFLMVLAGRQTSIPERPDEGLRRADEAVLAESSP